MHEFTDARGRTWELAVTLAGLKRVRDKLDIDLVGKDLARVATLPSDLLAFGDVLFFLLESQAKAAGVDDLAFAEGMGSEGLKGAITAYGAEMESFFRQLGQTSVAETIKRAYETAELVQRRGAAEINSPRVQAAIDRQMDDLARQFQQRIENLPIPSLSTTDDVSRLTTTHGSRSTNGPVTPASTPDP